MKISQWLSPERRNQEREVAGAAIFNNALDPRIGVAAQFFTDRREIFNLFATGFAAEDPGIWQELHSGLNNIKHVYGLTDEEVPLANEVALDQRFDASRNWHALAAQMIEQGKE